jgi:hypothetical protein
VMASMASKVRTPQQPKTESYRLEYRNSEKEAQQCRFITRGFLIESIRSDEDPDECKMSTVEPLMENGTSFM